MGCFLWGKEWGVELTTHLYLVLILRMSGNVNHFQQLCMTCTGITSFLISLTFEARQSYFVHLAVCGGLH